MVTLNNKQTLTISIIAGHHAWAFPSEYDLWLYIEGHVRTIGLPKPNKIDIVFNQTTLVTMHYEVVLEPINKAFAYRVLDTPIQHSKYGLIAAWGFWVHH